MQVLLAHPAALVREALGSLLTEQYALDVESGGADLAEAAGTGAWGRAPVALVCATLVRGRLPHECPPVVALLHHGPEGSLRPRALELLDDGVMGLVSTADSGHTVAEAVLTVAQGGAVFTSPRVGIHLQTAAAGGPRLAPLDALTPRERDVLAHATWGHRNTEIAAALGLSEGTVRNHLSAVYAKLDVRSRAEAAAWAWRHGLAREAPPRPESHGRAQCRQGRHSEA